MRNACRDDNETTCRIALQFGGVKPLALAHIPSAFDHCHHFIMRMRVSEDAPTAGYLHPIYPSAASARIAEQVRPLPPIVVVGRREPMHSFRSQSDNLFP